jgi:hypothetical protein
LDKQNRKEVDETMYLLTKEEIEALWEGKLNPQDVIRVEKEALLPLSGKAVIEMDGKVDDITEVKEILENADCWECLLAALDTLARYPNKDVK